MWEQVIFGSGLGTNNMTDYFVPGGCVVDPLNFFSVGNNSLFHLEKQNEKIRLASFRNWTKNPVPVDVV